MEKQIIITSNEEERTLSIKIKEMNKFEALGLLDFYKRRMFIEICKEIDEKTVSPVQPTTAPACQPQEGQQA